MGLELARGLIKEGQQVSICLLQDGIYFAVSRVWADRGHLREIVLNGVTYYVLQDDLIMRGFRQEEVEPRFKVINYPELVDLMMEDHQQVMGAF